MRIAAISDIHGNLDALDVVLGDISARGADLIVNLGDIVSGPLQPAETADLLMAMNLPTIRGNHERQLLGPDAATMGKSDQHAHASMGRAHFEWIASLPCTLSLNEEVFLCHGTPDSDMIYLLEDIDETGSHRAAPEHVAERAGSVNAALILCGHSHVPRATRLADGRLIVNAGSVGLQAYDWDVPLFHKHENGTPHTRYVMVEKTSKGWQAEFIALEYDWESAARLADQRGRPDWAVALRTGFAG
jgi:predicted phosphodiesterase